MKTLIVLALFVAPMSADEIVYRDGKLVKLTPAEIVKREAEREQVRQAALTASEEKPVTVKVLREILTKCDTVECVKIEVDKLD